MSTFMKKALEKSDGEINNQHCEQDTELYKQNKTCSTENWKDKQHGLCY